MIVERFRVRLDKIVSIPSTDHNFFLKVPLWSDNFLERHTMLTEVLCKFHSHPTTPSRFSINVTFCLKWGVGQPSIYFVLDLSGKPLQLFKFHLSFRKVM